MTTRTASGSTYTLGYDAENQLTTVSGATSGSFSYDGDGKRVKGTVGGVTTAYVGNYFEWTNAGITAYYYAGGQRIAMRRAGYTSDNGLFWLLGDHLGSTTVTANSAGVRTAELRYKPWGQARTGVGTTRTSYRFTGQRSEEAGIGLYWYNSRWYDALLGRFASPDSIIPGTENPLAWDRYAYSFNNPVKYNDPSGHCPFCLVAALVIGAIILTGDTPRVGAGEAANVADLIIDGLQHEEHANIVGEGLESLQNDPSVHDAQGKLVERITDVPEYGNQAYSYETISANFVADGPSGNWKEAAITGNQAFWMVRGGTISATDTNVSADGTINTTWHIQDSFDFIPGPDRSADYNFWASIVHYFYNDLLGAKESFPTDAYWNETIPPQYDDTTPQ